MGVANKRGRGTQISHLSLHSYLRGWQLVLKLWSTVHHQTGTGKHALMHSHCYWPCHSMVALVLSQKILAYTKGLSEKLQRRYVDVVRDIESVKAVIYSVRSG